MPNLRTTKYNINTLVYVSWLKKILFFSLLSYTLIIYFYLSSLLLSLFHITLLGYLSLCSTSFFGTLQHQTKFYKFSLICVLYKKNVIDKTQTLLSLSLHYLPSENPFFSLLISRSIFPLSLERTLGPKSSNSL